MDVGTADTSQQTCTTTDETREMPSRLCIAFDTVTNTSAIMIHKPPPPPPPDPLAETQQQMLQHDLFALPPSEAMRLLSASLELLVRTTGDVPPTPAPHMPTDPQMSGLQAEKDKIVRSHSDKNLARLRQQKHQQAKREAKEACAATVPSPPPPPVTGGKRPCDHGAYHDRRHDNDYQDTTRLQTYNAAAAASARLAGHQAPLRSDDGDEIDGVVLKPKARVTQQPSAAAWQRLTPPCSSRSSSSTSNSTSTSTSSSSAAAANAPSLSPPPHNTTVSPAPVVDLQQHGAITRKFYSKDEPSISIAQYLARLHRFCPMGAAVYLAASLYIYRLAVEERAMAVTRRNVHRLVLAGLRVATKALEDRSHPHGRFAHVGGVSVAELARLEMAFCFLVGFELVVGEDELRSHWAVLVALRG